MFGGKVFRECVWVVELYGSRLGPDSKLFVMLILESLNTKLLSLVVVIFGWLAM